MRKSAILLVVSVLALAVLALGCSTTKQTENMLPSSRHI